ncbi:putative ABC transporter, ATP-binding protein [Vibrio cholerae]|uniref:ATP-binding cassette domain-containing protein n=1 Tax=Vibrio cholerae TaxID=666 RepID=UPI00155EBA3A|nr:ATP-binding cassette domain-containing protein [Vibrio cholerae]NOE59278.1 ATP-binding cassette domain-containing protein [Vibrio cholerae]GHW79339.1 putative ABC transporter, ATP-binding protein [Vibrio cholerae]
MDAILRIEGGCLRRDNRTILSDINISIQRGKVNYILGENGSGKSLLFDIISGIYKLSEGKLYCEFGKHEIAYMPQEPYVPYTLNVKELVDYYVLLMTGNSARCMNVKFHPAMERLLEKAGSTRASKCSVGEIKLLISSLLFTLNNAKLFVLDEPTSGLSASNRKVFREIVEQNVTQGKTIVVSTHIEEDIADGCHIIRL